MMVLMQAGTSGQGRPACIRGILCLLASRRLPRGFSPGKPRPAQVRAGHLLLESARLARADCPRRGGFTRHEMRAHGVFPAMGTHPASAWSAGVVPAQTPQMSCLPPSPVPCPGASRCWTALLCSACGVPMRPAAHRGPSACFPAPVDSVQRRCKERSMCRWGPRAFASSLAARTSSRLCRRKSTCTFTLLAVHAADAYEEECDGSFHARHYTLLLRCTGVPSAPPHDE